MKIFTNVTNFKFINNKIRNLINLKEKKFALPKFILPVSVFFF